MKKKNDKNVEWKRLTHVLLCGVSKVRKLPPVDDSITLYDDLINVGATNEEAKFLVQRAKRLGIEPN